VSVVVLLQHGAKARDAADPGLTVEGRRQARLAADVLAPARPTLLVTSPRRRARETIRPLEAATGLPAEIDVRVRERMEFSTSHWPTPAEFLQTWARTTRDRDHVPPGGDSSRVAADRLRSAVVDHAAASAFTVVATHGGVTADLLRSLLGDAAVDPRHVSDGMPNGHLTTLLVAGDTIRVVGAGIPPDGWQMPQP
jgi:broad specificity phosphatase PhoE